MWDALDVLFKTISDLFIWGGSKIEEEVIITTANTEMTRHLFKDKDFVAKFKTTKEASLLKRLKMETTTESAFSFDEVEAKTMTRKTVQPKTTTK